MYQKQPTRSSSFRESLKALEADVQHANSLAGALPGDASGNHVQMRLSYSPFAPFILFFVEWMDYSCTDALPSYLGLLHILVYKAYVDGMPMLSSKERKASLREFYGLFPRGIVVKDLVSFFSTFIDSNFHAAVIYPSLRQLESELDEFEDNQINQKIDVLNKMRVENRRKLVDNDTERDEECGICLENGAKMVLPNCGHSLCMSCFHDWNVRSKSCPFCRGSLRRVRSGDLWVLISTDDIVDAVTVAKENLRHFYLYLENLPLVVHETHALLFDYMI